MKVFWGIIGVLAVVTAALLMSGRGDDSRPSDDSVATAQPIEPQVTMPEPKAQPKVEPTTESAPAKIDPPEATTKRAVETQAPTAVPAKEPVKEPTRQPEAKPAKPEQQGDGQQTLTPNAPAAIEKLETPNKEEDQAELDALVKELQSSAGVGEEAAATGDPQNGEPGADEPNAGQAKSDSGASEPSEGSTPLETPQSTPTGLDPKAEGDASGKTVVPAESAPIGEKVESAAQKPDPTKPEIIPSTFEKREDGSMLADKRFVIRGQGTKEKPYVVTWDMLVSASELYDPRRDKLKLPERIKMLDGKYVKVVGYVAFPIVAEGPNEMLAMLNAWDGCCIGVPPTPYDAVEVRLKENATAEQMMMGWGSVTGKFKVEPYLAANWLLGLYMMEDARLEAESM